MDCAFVVLLFYRGFIKPPIQTSGMKGGVYIGRGAEEQRVTYPPEGGTSLPGGGGIRGDLKLLLMKEVRVRGESSLQSQRRVLGVSPEYGSGGKRHD